MRASRTGSGRMSRVQSAARTRDLLMLTIIALCLAVLTALPAMANGDGSPSALSVVKVKPGQTLWSIAAAVKGERSTATTVAIIKSANGLHDSALAAGQTIKVPGQAQEPARADAR